MFPTAGYFRNVPCPFYKHGLCHRPYCHFRHSKPDTKSKKGSNADWTYGELIDDEAVDDETPQSKAEEQLMTIIKNLSPGKKQHGNSNSKKSVKFSFEEYDKDGGKELGNESTSTGASKPTEKLAKIKAKRHQLILPEDNSDPIPAPIVKEISDLLKITSATDQSAEIAEEIKRRKRTKKDVNQTNENSTETQQDGQETEDAEEDIEGKIFDVFEEEIPKKPPKLKDIDFFLPEVPQKTSKTKKRKKSSKTDKNFMKLLNESPDSSSESVDDSEATLRKLFEEYDPDKDSSDEDSQCSANEDEFKTTVHGDQDYILNNVTETVGAGSLKKRIAHDPSIETVRAPISKKGLPRRALMKPSYVSPSVAGSSKRLSTDDSSKISEVPTVSNRMSFTTEDGMYVGKKRRAHQLESINTESSQARESIKAAPPKRPRIAVEFGSKVPQVVRQRYLDKMIEEYTDKCKNLQEVYDKASEEENLIYSRCSGRQIYMNLCVNAIKKIRQMPKMEKELPKSPLDSAKPTIRPLPDTYAKIASQLAASVVPPKTVIRPSTISLANLDRKHSSLLANKKEMLVKKRKLSINDLPELTEDIFYEQILKYLATDQERWDNNYPKESKEKPGLAVYKEEKGSYHPTKRTCARCGKEFLLDSEGEYVSKNECNYHWGKLRRMRGRGGVGSQFSCCQGEAGSYGCSVAKLHVSDYVTNNEGYASTKPHNKVNTRKVYSMDCEMCYTSYGLELTRLTIVDFDLKQVLDVFVKPEREIIDYNTRFSGVTEKHLRNVNVTLKLVQKKLLKLFGTDTILLGHSLESDMRALKLIHHKIVDTALIFPHRLGLPFKRALKTLMGEFLQKIIQDSDGGHDSYEDAASCMELMRWKVTENLKKQARTTSAHVR